MRARAAGAVTRPQAPGSDHIWRLFLRPASRRRSPPEIPLPGVPFDVILRGLVAGAGVVVCQKPAAMRLSWRVGAGRYRVAGCERCPGKALRAAARRLVLIVPVR